MLHSLASLYALAPSKSAPSICSARNQCQAVVAQQMLFMDRTCPPSSTERSML
jgi:hypothetical protein